MRLGALVALVLVAGATGAAELRDDGNELLEKCAQVEPLTQGRDDLTQEQALSAVWCLGLVQGVSDVVMSVAGANGTCMSGLEEATTGQVARVVLEFLRRHPEKLNQGGTPLVMLALDDAFPPVPCEEEER